MELWCSVESLFETILENQSLQSDFSLTSNPGTVKKKKEPSHDFLFWKSYCVNWEFKMDSPWKNTKRFILSFWSIYLLEMICGPAHLDVADKRFKTFLVTIFCPLGELAWVETQE